MAAAPEELELSRSQELKETSSLEGKAQEPVTEKTSLLRAGSKNIQVKQTLLFIALKDNFLALIL